MIRNNRIKWLVLSSTIGFAAGARPSKPLEESVWIKDPQFKYYLDLKKNPDLVIDHRKAAGFELYGPKGMIKSLDANHIPHSDLESASKEVMLSYPSFAQLETKLKDLAAKYPEHAQLISVGKSVRGKDLYFLKISKNAAVDAHLPEFKYISTMHGDEVTGRELMVSLSEELLSKYGQDASITELVDNTEIYIMPSMNPDGTESKQRYNANGADLNRDFPDFTSDPTNTTDGRQVETAAIMNFEAKRNFAMSANFHGGSEVVNYPWDTTDARHPFDSLIQSLSLTYTKVVPYIFNSTSFNHGITNGFDWYEVDGGMQDWSDYWYNDLQFTIELSNTKWPNYSDIPNYYQNNRPGLLQFIRNIHQGTGFYFKDAAVEGTVSVQHAGKEVGNYNFRNGEFYRVLEPGTYDFIVKTKDARSFQFSQNVVTNTITPGGNYIVLN
jgi:hypothetical protein